MAVRRILIAGGAVLIAGAVAAAAILRKGRRRPEEAAGPMHAAHPLMAEALAELAAHTGAFIGLYEPVYMIQNSMLRMGREVFADWDTRISNLEDAPALAQFWNGTFAGFAHWDDDAFKQKAEELLEFMRRAGIARSGETEVTVNREVFRYYTAKNGIRLEPGTKAMVETPCWHIGGAVLEKGIISKIN